MCGCKKKGKRPKKKCSCGVKCKKTEVYEHFQQNNSQTPRKIQTESESKNY